jgi:class 3 adenylate cyclase
LIQGESAHQGCPQCSAENAPAAKFCGDCGAALSPPVQPPVAEASPVHRREVAGERPYLTVLFCDLVGSTGIAAQLDPEEWRDMVAGYQRTAAEAITRFGGHVAKYR